MSQRIIKRQPVNPNSLEAQLKAYRLHNNPLPDNGDRYLVLRNTACCPAPEVMKESSALFQNLADRDLTPHESLSYVDLIGQQATQAATLDRTCKTRTQKRVVCTFSKDEHLNDVHSKIAGIDKEVEKLVEKINLLRTEAETLLEDRWNYAVKQYGLDPEKNCYYINEADGTIELYSLDCSQCTELNALKETVVKAHHLIDDIEKDKTK
jgi:hypothetical protein